MCEVKFLFILYLVFLSSCGTNYHLNIADDPHAEPWKVSWSLKTYNLMNDDQKKLIVDGVKTLCTFEAVDAELLHTLQWEGSGESVLLNPISISTQPEARKVSCAPVCVIRYRPYECEQNETDPTFRHCTYSKFVLGASAGFVETEKLENVPDHTANSPEDIFIGDCAKSYLNRWRLAVPFPKS